MSSYLRMREAVKLAVKNRNVEYGSNYDRIFGRKDLPGISDEEGISGDGKCGDGLHSSMQTDEDRNIYHPDGSLVVSISEDESDN